MHPITYNHYFTENIQNMRRKKLQERFEMDMKKHLGANFRGLSTPEYITPSDFVKSISAENDADMDRFACSEIVDYMGAYYKVCPPFAAHDPELTNKERSP